MFKEFKEFIKRGNAMELAIAFVMGGAFTAIVNSLVNDLIMPVVSLITGGMDFSSLFVALDGKQYANLKELEEAGAAAFKYGSFIMAVINFLIIAFVLFLIVKAMNRMKKEEEVVEEVTTKTCPACKMEIPLEATRCPHCTTEL